MNDSATPEARRKARHFALQALYQWQISRTIPRDIVLQFRTDFDMGGADIAYFNELVTKTLEFRQGLEAQFVDLLDRKLDDLDPVELSLLRMCTYELVHRVDVPFRVVISEGVRLAKKFGATDGHKYINGVLDKVAHRVRQSEINAR